MNVQSAAAYVPVIVYAGMVDGEYRARYHVVRETEKAICIEMTGDRNEWFPFTKITIVENDSGIFIAMPVWMAKQKGLPFFTNIIGGTDIDFDNEYKIIRF